jgi:hypothetical protein
MKTAKYVTILVAVLGLAGPVWGENGQVRFRGTVMTDETHGVVPVCYGDYHVNVAIETMLADPNRALTGTRSVQVCYESAHRLVTGDSVEVSGYYWGGICPKQYCGRVQILLPSDYIRLLVEYGDNDWMVQGDDMYSIPPGNVGIGTHEPREKLHVVGNVLVEGASPAWLKLLGTLGNDAGISMTATGVGGNTWEFLRRGKSSDLLITERFPYPPFTGDRVVVQARTGHVGIGTPAPAQRLHVLGAALIEVPLRDPVGEALRVVKEGTGRQLAAYFVNPRDGAAETEVQLAGGTALPWGWSLLAAEGSFSIGNVVAVPPTLTLTGGGFVGLGHTTPSYRLELPNTATAAGQARANAWRTYSSARWKTNIRTIDNAMDRVGQLRGVRFTWKDSGTHDIGMIAEEVARVIPEVVDCDADGGEASSLTYDRLVALLVEAIKEQEARIAGLEKALAQRDRMDERLEALERLMAQTHASDSDIGTQP